MQASIENLYGSFENSVLQEVSETSEMIVGIKMYTKIHMGICHVALRFPFAGHFFE